MAGPTPGSKRTANANAHHQLTFPWFSKGRSSTHQLRHLAPRHIPRIRNSRRNSRKHIIKTVRSIVFLERLRSFLDGGVVCFEGFVEADVGVREGGVGESEAEFYWL